MEKITFRRARLEDAQLIHDMKYRAFLPLYEKYRDTETSPVMEKIEKVKRQLGDTNTVYDLIEMNDETVGAIRIVQDGVVEGLRARRISPLFILPEYQGRGIGQRTMRHAFLSFPDTQLWRLATIKEEERNCRLYEKCGFVRTGENPVNASMTLVFYEKKGSDIV